MAPDLVEPAQRLLARISPPNWTLEWSLPGWLGQALGLAPADIAGLTLSNVLGLAYVRLQDDLADDEVPGEDRPAALLLSTVLFERWMQAYVGLFWGEPRFWPFLRHCLAEWVGATLRSHRPWPLAFRNYDASDLRILGQRGAPLKICAAGACLLAGRDPLISQLESALDHLLTGAVLLDHVLDWADDLATGRYNAFVACATPAAQVPEHADANRRAVLQELAIGRAAQSYFRVLRRQLLAARQEARAAAIGGLADYAAWLQGQADACGRGLTQGSRAELRRLVDRAIGPVLPDEVPTAAGDPDELISQRA